MCRESPWQGENTVNVFRCLLSISPQMFFKNVTRNGSGENLRGCIIFMNIMRNYRSMGAAQRRGRERRLRLP